MAEDQKHAVVLVSGGLDSATVLAIARSRGFACHAITISYGQRHKAEINAAKRVAKQLEAVEHQVYELPSGIFQGSALTNHEIDVPTGEKDAKDLVPTEEEDIPVTYVPARNTIFLSLCLAWAESLGAKDIFIGANAVDYSGYPDCRPEFMAAYGEMANLATKSGVQGNKTTIHTPLISMEKSDIIRTGFYLEVDYSQTVSCYQATEDGLACGKCDSCKFRQEGFRLAGIADPTRYVPGAV